MSDYPVGAMWEGKDEKHHRIVAIWLEDRYPNGTEIWKWRWWYKEGGAPVDAFDWNTSYRGCKDALPFTCRMKRVK